jgi:Ca-activated chloride channel homolog
MEIMKRRLGLSWVALVLALLLSAAPAQAQQTDAEAHSATVYVTPQGSPASVTTLDSSQISISVDGQPAQLLSARKAGADPILYAVLVDVSTSTAQVAPQVRLAAAEVFQSLSTPDERGYLAAFNEHMAASKTPLSPAEAASTLPDIHFVGGTAFFDAIKKTSDEVLGKRTNPGSFRRIMVVLSDGEDNSSRIRLDDALKAAAQEGITIFAISTSAERDKGEQALENATRATGGELFVPRQLDQGVIQVVAAIHDQWALSIASPALQAKGWHKLSLKTNGKDIHFSVPSLIFTE